jgi:hypothetical protein
VAESVCPLDGLFLVSCVIFQYWLCYGTVDLT